ncbi:PKD domain-containing protein [Pleionea litopenaei]|uniref:Teneurin-like YD-shell domain-containing protein n=1 Tax=Pleionea litopenaei TaxID=3070815 RepID=A0AA51X634_9GAMM|nr:hypothetical protein [Pleionea sp. HL-JVS1]WMS86693.1 hypothetical protein Q9312_15845 [Pleionea sp. HL-JVS1]
MPKLLLSTFLCALFSFTNSVHSEITDSPDFYSMPGINKGRAYDSSSNVNIDLFGGSLNISSTDLVASGLGPDIVVTRSFNSATDRWKDSYRNFVGAHWILHYGMLRGATENPYYCGQGTVEPVLANNTQFILPDGSSQIIIKDNISFIDADGDSAYSEGSGDYRPSHVTKALWRVNCKNQQLQITDKSGTSYIIGDYSLDYRVIKIIDRNGNYLDINYSGDRANIRIDSIVSSDSRTVNFTYNNNVLESVSYGDQTVTYEVVGALSEQRLLSVTHPDNALTEYKYYSSGEVHGYLEQLTTPLGKIVKFDYEKLNFSAKDYYVVTQKCEANRETPAATNRCWDYVYTRQGEEGETKSYDVTTVTGPDGVKTYKHYGLYYPIPLNESVYIDQGDGEGYFKPVGQAWSVGLLKEMSHVVDGQEVFKEVNNWSFKELSFIERTYTEANTSYSLWDPDIRIPILIGKTTTIDNTTYDYEVTSLDGLTPEKYNESGNANYYYDEDYRHIGSDAGHWILDLPFKKHVRTTGSDILVEQFTYDENGNLSQTISKGVLVKYEYNTDGTLKAKSDAVDNKVSYLNYYRGIPRREEFPDGSFIIREVDAYGRVTSETNAKDTTTSYSYDELNRLTFIDYPVSDDVVVTYGYGMGGPTNSGTNSNRGHWVAYTRNSLRQVNIYNEHNKLVRKITENTISGQQFIRYYRYDDLNRLVFESYVNDEMRGTTYSYDGLDRVVRAQKFGQPAVVTDYLSDGTVRVTDAEGNVTTKSYTAYSYSNKHLKKITAPEGVVIDFTNNALGDPLTITQNGIVREYQYDNEQRLFKYIEPEVDGELIYFYDHGGRIEEEIHVINGTQRTKRFSYDVVGRLRRVEFPTFFKTESGYQYGQPSCTSCNYEAISKEYELDYDEIGNLKSNRVKTTEHIFLFNPQPDQYTQTSYRTWFYTYDIEDKLETETLSDSEEGTNFAFSYDYNTQGQISGLTYPSGFYVDYDPDVFGRASKVGDLVTNIEYFDNGVVKSLTYSNGHVTTYELNDQQMPQSMSVGMLDNIISFNYDYDFNGNLEAIIDNLDSSKTKNMSYDGLDRLYTASGVWGNGYYNYDSMGNIESKVIGGQTFNYDYDARNRLSNFNGNQFLYDFNGRVKEDGRNSYFYDFSNNLIFAKNTANGMQFKFEYDANGKQSVKIGPEKKEYFVYTTSGKLLFEQDEFGDFNRSHIYLGNKLVAYYDEQIECSDDLDNDGLGHCFEREYGLDPYDSSDAGADLDDDGLSNLEEFIAGTRLDLVDTDGDGLSDWFEVTYGLDSNIDDSALDPDGDGLSNLEEFQLGTNPNVANTLNSPTALNAASIDGVVWVSWNAIDFADSYDLYWSNQPFSSKEEAIKVDDVSSPWVHTTPQMGDTVYYRVIAKRGSLESSLSNERSVKHSNNQWYFASMLNYPIKNLDIDSGGNVHVLHRYHSNKTRASYWNSTTEELTVHELFDFRPNRYVLEVSDSGYAMAVASDSSTAQISVATFDVPTKSWSTETLKTPESGFNVGYEVGITSSTNGNFVVSWLEEQYSTVFLWVASWTPSTGWSEPVKVTYKDENHPLYNAIYSGAGFDFAINNLGQVAIIIPLDERDSSGNIVSTSVELFTIDSTTFNGYSLGSEDWQTRYSIAANNQQLVALWEDVSGSGRNYLSQRANWQQLLGSTEIVSSVSNAGGPIAIDIDDNNKSTAILEEQGKIKLVTQAFNSAWLSHPLSDVDAPSGTSDSVLTRFVNGSFGYIYTDYDYQHHSSRVINDSVIYHESIPSSTTGSYLAPYSALMQGARVDKSSNNAQWPLFVYLSKAEADNTPPVANAGNDQTVNEGEIVILDARGSSDAESNQLNVSWEVVSGPNVVFQQGIEPLTTQFIAPSVDVDTQILLRVTVTDDAGAESSDEVSITVSDLGDDPVRNSCELDFDENGIVEEKDFFSSSYEGIYYAVFIHLNYPSLYSNYFPNTPIEKLDWNGDGNITIEEVYTGTISVETLDTFQTQHYFYLKDKDAYASYYPNSGCAM